jgi:hypothetical protein
VLSVPGSNGVSDEFAVPPAACRPMPMDSIAAHLVHTLVIHQMPFPDAQSAETSVPMLGSVLFGVT